MNTPPTRNNEMHRRRPPHREMDKLEAEIAAITQSEYHTPVPDLPPPSATAPATAPAQPDLGRLSAEAVRKQYETAAHNVELMGEAVKERINKLTTALEECDNDMRLLSKAAEAIRDKGKLVEQFIADASAVSADIRSACADFVKKVNGQ